MDAHLLPAVAAELLVTARDSSSGRSARTLLGGQEVVLRQTVLALLAGHGLDEHESPGTATLQVLHGRVRLTAGDESWEGGVGDHVVIPPRRHALAAIDDSAVLLTVVPSATQ